MVWDIVLGIKKSNRQRISDRYCRAKVIVAMPFFTTFVSTSMIWSRCNLKIPTQQDWKLPQPICMANMWGTESMKMFSSTINWSSSNAFLMFFLLFKTTTNTTTILLCWPSTICSGLGFKCFRALCRTATVDQMNFDFWNFQFNEIVKSTSSGIKMKTNTELFFLKIVTLFRINRLDYRDREIDQSRFRYCRCRTIRYVEHQHRNNYISRPQHCSRSSDRFAHWRNPFDPCGHSFVDSWIWSDGIMFDLSRAAQGLPRQPD